jgi:chemotaxis protein MotB
MATFSDMVTLLMTFFVMLMAMANFEDTQRVEAVFHSIKSALGVGADQLNRVGAHNERQSMTPDLRRQDSFQPIMAKLRSAFSKHLSDDLIRMTNNEQEIRLRLDDRVLFRPGSAELHPAAYALLTDIANVLATESVEIRVEGHSDADGTPEANWRLSGERALSVVLALNERGPIPGDRLEADAFGQYRPAAGFGEVESWNRRVELVLRSDNVNIAGAVELLSNPGGSDGR